MTHLLSKIKWKLKKILNGMIMKTLHTKACKTQVVPRVKFITVRYTHLWGRETEKVRDSASISRQLEKHKTCTNQGERGK